MRICIHGHLCCSYVGVYTCVHVYIHVQVVTYAMHVHVYVSVLFGATLTRLFPVLVITGCEAAGGWCGLYVDCLYRCMAFFS